MNARKFTLGFGLLLGIAGCDGSTPHIKSLSASSTNLPLPGGEVTITWSVKGEDHLSLKPFPGAVHGTGITLTLTESTDFTLVAKGNGRSDRETIHIGVGEPFTVSGRAVGASYGPAAGFTVFVNGTTPAYTDAQGNFRIEGVVAPYDLVVLDPSLTNVPTVYKGLTRTDPTVVALGASLPFTTSVSGTVSGVVYPVPVGPPAVVDRLTFFSPLGYRNYSQPNPGTGAINFGLAWGNDSTTPISFTTLRWVDGVDGLPATFPGYARTKTSLEDGVPFIFNPTLAPVAATQLSGSVTRHPSLTSPVSLHATVDFGTSAAVPMSGPSIYALLDVVDLEVGSLGTATTFTRSAPDVASAFAVTAQSSGASGSMTVTRRNLSAGASGIALDIPEHPHVLLPVQNATISSSTLFTLASNDEMVNIFNFILNGGAFSVFVVTDERSIGFPDLSAIGLSPAQIANGFFYAQTFGPYDSIDDATGPTAFIPTGDDSYSGYADCCRSFFGPGVP